MAVYSSAALKVIPSFQSYDDTTDFTSLICSNDDDGIVSTDDLEWLYLNFTLLISTTDYRISGSYHKLLIDRLLFVFILYL